MLPDAFVLLARKTELLAATDVPALAEDVKVAGTAPVRLDLRDSLVHLPEHLLVPVEALLTGHELTVTCHPCNI
jgi:hypothetical protein